MEGRFIIEKLPKIYCCEAFYKCISPWVRLCVCLSVTTLTDRPTDLNFGMEIMWKDIKVKFRGQGKRIVHWEVPLTSTRFVMIALSKKKLGNMMWHVFKAYALL